MNEPAQRLYEVRYPDGDTARLYAHHMVINDEGTLLRKAPGDVPGNVVFFASHTSGITVSQPASSKPPRVLVTGAPGYDEFEGDLIIETTAVDDRGPLGAVRAEWDGKPDLHVVPMRCVQWLS